VEVKIGVQYAARELIIDSAQSPAEVEAQVTDAIESGKNTITLVDEKGKRVIVPVAKLAYVEIAEATSRQVGFTVR
jgi:polysaccharide deacetylase 2 family uncharacterized protein YibQ